MIRRISLLLAFCMMSTWLFGSHNAKHKLIFLQQNLASDNIQFTYEDLKVSIYPFGWKILLENPKLSITDQGSFREIFTPDMAIRISLFMKDINIDFGKVVHYKTDQKESGYKYSVVSDDNIIVNVGLKDPLYDLNSLSKWRHAIVSSKFSSEKLEASDKKDKLFTLSDINIIFDQQYGEKSNKRNIKFVSGYASKINYFGTKRGRLLLNLDHITNNMIFDDYTDLDFDYKVKLSKVNLDLDDASLDMNGDLKFTRNASLRGDLDILMGNHNQIIDKLLPSSFVASSTALKQIISQINLSERGKNNPNSKINFKVNFSKNGVSVGKLNRLEIIK